MQDCVSDEFYALFRRTSRKNTIVYDDVFKCLPSDNVLTYAALTSYADRSCLCVHDPRKVASSPISTRFVGLTLVS